MEKVTSSMEKVISSMEKVYIQCSRSGTGTAAQELGRRLSFYLCNSQLTCPIYRSVYSLLVSPLHHVLDSLALRAHCYSILLRALFTSW